MAVRFPLKSRPMVNVTHATPKTVSNISLEFSLRSECEKLKWRKIINNGTDGSEAVNAVAPIINCIASTKVSLDCVL